MKCKDVPKKKCVALIAKRGGGGDQRELPRTGTIWQSPIVTIRYN